MISHKTSEHKNSSVHIKPDYRPGSINDGLSMSIVLEYRVCNSRLTLCMSFDIIPESMVKIVDSDPK